MARIPLPTVHRRANAQAHPFPFQIALQTQEFLQAILFHSAFADIAAGELACQPGGVGRVEQILRESGLDGGVADQAWLSLRTHRVVFEGAVFQSALIALDSHWDWYVRRLSAFIRFGRDHCGGPALSNDDAKRLKRAARLPLCAQLKTIEVAAGISLQLAATELEELAEMSLVRNLGLHNRWEVDADYLRQTNRSG